MRSLVFILGVVTACAWSPVHNMQPSRPKRSQRATIRSASIKESPISLVGPPQPPQQKHMNFRRNIAAAAACAAVAVILPQSAFAIDVASSGVAVSSFLQSAASNVNSILNTELFTYFAKSVINVAVPAAVFFVAAIYLFSG